VTAEAPKAVQALCDPERYGMERPFTQGGRTWATNGYVLLSWPSEQAWAVEDEGNAPPNLNQFFVDNTRGHRPSDKSWAGLLRESKEARRAQRNEHKTKLATWREVRAKHQPAIDSAKAALADARKVKEETYAKYKGVRSAEARKARRLAADAVSYRRKELDKIKRAMPDKPDPVVPCGYLSAGNGREIILDAGYVVAIDRALKATGHEVIEILCGGSLSPVRFRCTGDVNALIMPRRH
jgi:hypothetical protein